MTVTIDSEPTTYTVTDLYFGDVFLISGQSNAEFTMAQLPTADLNAAIADSDYPLLRVFDTGFREYSDVELTQFARDGLAWKASKHSNVKTFSAIGWLFSRHIHKHFGIPVGLIVSTTGGSRIVHWMPKDYLDPSYFPLKTPYNYLTPTVGYNANIAPMWQFTLKAVLWYQGEADAVRARTTTDYANLLTAKIAAWRSQLNQPGLFWIVFSLPNYLPDVQDQPIESIQGFPLVREAIQDVSRNVHRVYTVVSNDDITDYDIHPLGKVKLANRAFALAREKIYLDGTHGTSPRPMITKIVGSTLEVYYDRSYLIPSQPSGFAITDASKKVWYFANAKVIGRKVVLSHPLVTAPTYWRYSWASNPIGNLHTVDGFYVDTSRNDR